MLKDYLRINLSVKIRVPSRLGRRINWVFSYCMSVWVGGGEYISFIQFLNKTEV